MQKILCLLLVAGSLAGANALAGNRADWRTWPMGDRAAITIGAFYATLDTQVGFTDSDITIDLEDELGLTKSKATGLAGAYWRISKRNTISVQYFTLDRSAFATTTDEIDWGDGSISAGDIYSFFDIENTSINYSYSFIMREKHELYAGLGLSWQNYKIGLKNQDTQESASFKATAPLPAINIGYNHAFSDKWVWRNRIGGLVVSLDLDDDQDFSGSVWDLTTGIEWRAWRYASIGVSYDFFRVNLDVTNKPTDITAAVKYDYHGPKLFFVAHF